MKYGVRECANITFRAKNERTIGGITFKKGQPVIILDTGKTSTLEGATTTVYAQGGRGNARLIAWDGEKTLTFTVEEALISPVGLSILSGAGLLRGKEGDNDKVHVHYSSATTVGANRVIDLKDVLPVGQTICGTAPIFVLETEADGSIKGEITTTIETVDSQTITLADDTYNGKTVFVDFYGLASSTKVNEIQIDANSFGGNFYVEADTLFRNEDGVDYPAIITLPNVKVQSNFSFSLSGTGDPSTFTFTMDAFPGYTYFNNSKKVMCVIQVVDENAKFDEELKPVMGHDDEEDIEESYEDAEGSAPLGIVTVTYDSNNRITALNGGTTGTYLYTDNANYNYDDTVEGTAVQFGTTTKTNVSGKYIYKVAGLESKAKARSAQQ